MKSISLEVVGFSDADWEGCAIILQTTTGLCVFLVSNYISRSSKKHHTVSKSSVEAEYHGVSSLVA